MDGSVDIVCAIDQDEYAHRTYTASWTHRARRWNIAALRPGQLPEAEVWWMSPPCQPFTVRGARRDLDDPRSAPFRRVLELVAAIRPRAVALENVPTFEGSRAHEALREVLDRAGYMVAERHLCPGQLGVPNKRPRFYLVASLDDLRPWRPVARVPCPLAEYLDPEPDASLYVPDALLDRFGDALAITDLDHPEPQIHCLTSAYGRSPVHAGSYVRDARGVRWLSPEEILRLLGFPPTVVFPADLPRSRRYKLAGNSLSVPAVREVLGALDGV